MSSVNELQDILIPFFDSAERKTLKDFPDDFIVESIVSLDQLMLDYGHEKLITWDKYIIMDVLNGLVEFADKDNDADSNTLLLTLYDVYRSFLKFAASNHKLGVNRDSLDDMLDIFEMNNGLQGGPIPFSLNQEEPIDDGLPQWLEYVHNDIMSYTHDWVSSYIASPAWKKREKGVTENLVSVSMEVLTEDAYAIYRKTPKTWTKTAISGVLSTRFVSNIDFSEEEYEHVAPALSGLLDFVADNGWLNAKRSENFKRYIIASAPEMIELSKDPANFSPSKLIGKKMVEQGIDLKDENEVQNFMDELNANGGVDSLLDDNEFDFDDDDDDDDEIETSEGIEEVLNNPEQLSRVAEVYDGDPEKMYLEAGHLDELGSVKWSRDTAMKVHNQGVQFALSIWLQRDKYKLIPGAYAADIIEVISDIVDTIYAQHLETPSQWTRSTWKEFGAWARANEPAQQIDLIEILFTMLGDNGTFTNKKSKDLISELRGNIISLDKVRKSKGKIRKKKK
ncbi:hypothetical protein [Companilactobacillus mishanensis]|uniref:Uncharacterized protein n=1 Tax=Companilactobacillus mishanensis TaxID=2486008 RepID=A0A5P0ZK27_9LACO|nr:hypothetical protein [Companilactobacillus mishanensis]MQS53461.1 hypothetical protein [Companilactobacillus mishanensis]